MFGGQDSFGQSALADLPSTQETYDSAGGECFVDDRPNVPGNEEGRHMFSIANTPDKSEVRMRTDLKWVEGQI
jgi:hypothetical protein